MTVIIEGEISITIPASCSAVRFDGADHGLSHCMKAVDFLIETPGALIFLELKDPTPAPLDRQQDWMNRLSSGKIDNELKAKFRDSWLYLYGTAKLNKPVNYLVLLGVSSLSSEALAARTEALKRQIPIEGPNGPWAQRFIAGCAVHNIDTWNRSFDQFPVSRV